MGLLKDLQVAATRWSKARGGEKASQLGEAEREELRRWFQALKERAGSDLVYEMRLVEIDAKDLPWIDTGLEVFEGEWISTFAAGRVVLSDPLDIWIGPAFQLWMRVGERGTIFNGTRDTNTFCATGDGRLYFASYFPGQWGDSQGRVSTSLTDYETVGGGMTVAIVRWRREASTALAELSGDPRIAAEAGRLDDNTAPPEGWDYLWFLGRSETFRTRNVDGHHCIACDTSRSASILQRDVAIDLVPGTRIAWSWKVDELPSQLPEDSLASHDYLSVAVEFENGRDITYTWSSKLAEGTGYWCPLPTWKDREFHVVVRSGAESLGAWLDESRDLCDDYRRFIGTPPKRVVRVWLIAVSIFQGGRGRAAYRDLRLEGPGGPIPLG